MFYGLITWLVHRKRQPRLSTSVNKKWNGAPRFRAMLVMAPAVLWLGASTSAMEPVVGITAPFRQATLSAIQPGRVARLAASEGSTVKAGELIFSLEDGGQEARALMAEADAASTLDVELAQARWERARRDWERIQEIAEASGQDFATRKELGDAVSEERIRRVELRIAEFLHAQNTLAARRERQVLEQYRVLAPFDGYVTQYLKDCGETVNENEAVVTLAQLDPLIVTLDCPLRLAATVAVGDRVRVHPADEAWPAREGVVSFASRVADGGSQTFRIELKVDNADQRWIAGLKVTAEFPVAERSAAASATDQATDPRIP